MSGREGPRRRRLCLGRSAAAELTLRPGALGGFLARIRKVKSDAPRWIRERRAAYDADVESVPGRGRIVVTRLLARYAPAIERGGLSGLGGWARFGMPGLPAGEA